MAKRITDDLFRCPRCGESKAKSEYYSNRSAAHGIQCYCKTCWDTHPSVLRSYASQLDKKRGNPVALAANRERSRKHRERDRERYNAKNRANYRKDIERSRERTRANAQRYRDANRDLVNQRARAYFHENPEVNRARAHVRRARLAGVMHEPYERIAVYERDGWVCQLCGGSIDRQASVRSRKATIDHIIPIAKGGADAFDNVQAAHLGCNARKRDRVAA